MHSGILPTWVLMSLLYDIKTGYTLETISEMGIRPESRGQLEAYLYLEFFG